MKNLIVLIAIVSLVLTLSACKPNGLPRSHAESVEKFLEDAEVIRNRYIAQSNEKGKVQLLSPSYPSELSLELVELLNEKYAFNEPITTPYATYYIHDLHNQAEITYSFECFIGKKQTLISQRIDNGELGSVALESDLYDRLYSLDASYGPYRLVYSRGMTYAVSEKACIPILSDPGYYLDNVPELQTIAFEDISALVNAAGILETTVEVFCEA